MADETQRPHKTRLDIEARPKLTGMAAFKNSLGDLAWDLAEPGIVLASGGSAAQAAWAGMRGILMSRVLGPLGLITGAVVGLSAAMKVVIGQSQLLARGLSEARGMETMITQFRPLLGGAQAAKARLAELFKFAETTPFQINEIAESSRILEIMTNGALSTSAGLRMIGDSAAIAGRPLQEVSFWVGRLYDALQSGGPTGEAMMRLQEMGVVSGSTRRKIEQLTEAGANSRGVWAIVEKELKRNAGGMELLSQSAVGLESTLSDARAAMARGFGENFLELEKEQIKAAITVTEAFTPVVAELGKHVYNLQTMFGLWITKAKQSRDIMDALAGATMVAMNAFMVFGAAVVGAQLTATIIGVTKLTGQIKNLSTILKVATINKVGLGKAIKIVEMSQRSLAKATALEIAAKKASVAADSQILVAQAAKRKAFAQSLTGTEALSKGMAKAGVRGKVLSGVLKGFKGLGALIGGAFKAAFITLTTGITGLVGALLAVGMGLFLIVQRVKQARQALQDLREVQQDNTKEYLKQFAAMKTVQDRLKLEQTLLGQLKSAYAKLREEKEKNDKTGRNEEGVRIAKETVRQLNRRLEAVRKTKKELGNENDREDAIAKADLETRIDDTLFRGQMSRADGEQKAVLLAEKQLELKKRIAAAEKLQEENRADDIKGVELEVDREKKEQVRDNLQDVFEKEKERLLKNVRKMEIEELRRGRAANADYSVFGGASNAEEARENINKGEVAALKFGKEKLDLLNDEIKAIEAQEKAIRDKQAAAAEDVDNIKVQKDLDELNQRKQEAEELKQQIIDLKTLQDERAKILDAEQGVKSVEEDIAAAKASGDMEALAAAQEQLRAAEKRLFMERRIAELKGVFGEAEARRRAEEEFEVQEDTRRSRERDYRNQIEQEIAINKAKADGRTKEARGMVDAQRLRELTEQNILRGGMGADEAAALAEEQLRAQIAAEEKGKGSNIVADSFQRLGLGGFSAGSDPAQRTRERMLEAQKQANKYLQDISDGGPIL